MEHTHLTRECAKLDPELEKAMAEEGMSEDRAEWPAYSTILAERWLPSGSNVW